MITSLHLLLTYTCSYACDHCFLYSSPEQTGVFSLEQLTNLICGAKKIKSIRSISFEGGEPFLYYGLLHEGIRQVTQAGFNTAVETNCYWATGVEDAKLWLRPLQEVGLKIIEPGDDSFHHGDIDVTPGQMAAQAARELGMTVKTICVEKPKVINCDDHIKGEPVYAGGPKLRGRAVETLVKDLPRKPWDELTECKMEKLRDPGRVHIDPFGNVHICQGLSMGNYLESSLAEVLTSYDPDTHPVCGPLLKGGPAALARQYSLPHADQYVDECHFCSKLCKSLVDRFPKYLTPRQVFGL
ncbi:MAG: 4Fe-4S cluster-binding domain-containing protein [Desulfobacteraceae bacterium]|nr:4Fe-4S cluster-binding domain-containing protein [Desulfobacteraceae bacterium]